MKYERYSLVFLGKEQDLSMPGLKFLLCHFLGLFDFAKLPHSTVPWLWSQCKVVKPIIILALLSCYVTKVSWNIQSTESLLAQSK